MTERVTTDDNMIPPAAQRRIAKRAGATTVAEAKGSHSITVSQLRAMIKLIEQAAKST